MHSLEIMISKEVVQVELEEIPNCIRDLEIIIQFQDSVAGVVLVDGAQCWSDEVYHGYSGVRL